MPQTLYGDIWLETYHDPGEAFVAALQEGCHISRAPEYDERHILSGYVLWKDGDDRQYVLLRYRTHYVWAPLKP